MSSIFKRVTTILMVAVMSVGLCVGLAACSGGSANNDEEQIRSALDSVLGTLKNPTEESLKDMMGGDTSSLDSLSQYGVDPVELLQHMFSKFNYTIDDVAVEGDSATAKITVENVDVQTVVTEATQEWQNDPEFVAEIQDAYLNGGDDAMTKVYQIVFKKMYEALDAATDTISNTVDVKLTKTDGKWDIDQESMKELVSKMYGGLDLSSLSL